MKEWIEGILCRDDRFKWVHLVDNDYTDAELSDLFDCLLAHPDFVTRIYVHYNHLTDETGMKVARLLTVSSTLKILNLSNNLFSAATFLAIAAALRVNCSLRILDLYNNKDVDKVRVDNEFISALRINPRVVYSAWRIHSYSWFDVDHRRLQIAAKELGHPTLQELLLGRHLGREVSAERRNFE